MEHNSLWYTASVGQEEVGMGRRAHMRHKTHQQTLDSPWGRSSQLSRRHQWAWCFLATRSHQLFCVAESIMANHKIHKTNTQQMPVTSFCPLSSLSFSVCQVSNGDTGVPHSPKDSYENFHKLKGWGRNYPRTHLANGSTK